MLDIDPAPVGRREATDFFRNWRTVVELEEPHETLTVKLAARVSVAAGAPPPAAPAPPRGGGHARTHPRGGIRPASPPPPPPPRPPHLRRPRLPPSYGRECSPV